MFLEVKRSDFVLVGRDADPRPGAHLLVSPAGTSLGLCALPHVLSSDSPSIFRLIHQKHSPRKFWELATEVFLCKIMLLLKKNKFLLCMHNSKCLDKFSKQNF